MVNIKQLIIKLAFAFKSQLHLIDYLYSFQGKSLLNYSYSNRNIGSISLAINLRPSKCQIFNSLNKSNDSLNKQASPLNCYISFVKDWLFYKNTNLETKSMDCGLGLTKRELEILSLVSRELSSDEIADHLVLSKHTIISHRKKLLIKMGAKNTAGMIRKGFELGYLSMTKPQ